MPRTEAGKALVRDMLDIATSWIKTGASIAAIEAEAYDNGVIDQKLATLDAVAAERERIRAAVEGLLFDARMDGRGGVHDYIDRAAVLAIIDREDDHD